MNIDPTDRGLLLGDGLFETLLWRAGALGAFAAHAGRLREGCAVLGLPAPAVETLKAAALAAVERAGLAGETAAVRLTLTAGPGGRGLDRPDTPRPRLLAAAVPYLPPVGPLRLATVQIRRNEGTVTSRLKTLANIDNILARRAAHLGGDDEALMLNNRGEVACAAAANLFWFDGETLVTPALECGVLAGTVRAAVIDAATALGMEVRQIAAPAAALREAGGLFLTNSLIGIRAVSQLDGRATRPDPAMALLAGRASHPA